MIPTHDDTLRENWDRLYTFTSHLLVSHRNDEDTKYALLLNEIRHDRVVGAARLLGLYHAPASVSRHHNAEGGLVAHLLQMWDIWDGLRTMLRQHNAHHPVLSDPNVWKCILHHDLNKVWKYKLTWPNDETLGVLGYANELDRMSHLLGDTNKVICLLGKHGITLSPPILNALITAEGGYSPGPRPKTETVLAKVVCILDELSANVIDRLQTNRFWDSKEGGFNEVP